MGKGRRMREQRRNDASAYELPLAKAAKLESTVRALCIMCAVLLLLLSVMPVWSLSIISQNLAVENFYKEDIASAVTPILPLGQMAMVLIPIGALATGILLWLRKPPFALIGLGLNLVGYVMLVSFAITAGDVFAFDPITGRGLEFWELVLRYYSLVIPTVMLAVAVCMSFVAHQKRDVADSIRNATDATSTLSIGEEETTSILS